MLAIADIGNRAAVGQAHGQSAVFFRSNKRGGGGRGGGEEEEELK